MLCCMIWGRLKIDPCMPLIRFQKTQGFCVADFAMKEGRVRKFSTVYMDKRTLRSKIWRARNFAALELGCMCLLFQRSGQKGHVSLHNCGTIVWDTIIDTKYCSFQYSLHWNGCTHVTHGRKRRKIWLLWTANRLFNCSIVCNSF